MASQTLQTIRNGWAPEIKRLNDNLEKLEASLSGTDECVLDIYSLEETLQNKIHLIDAELTSVKTDIADLKDHLASVSNELEIVTGGGIEEELFAVKVENVEMRNHFNSMIKQLNEITAFVNQKHGYRIIEKLQNLTRDLMKLTGVPPLLLIPRVVHSLRSITSDLT